MNCELLLERVAVEGWSPDDPDPTMGAHLKVCAECRVRLPAAEALGRRLRDPLLWEDPPAGLVDSILEEATGAAYQPTPARPWWLVGVAAALVVVVLGVGALLNRPDWTVELAGGEAAPLARGVVSGWVSDGETRMVFEMENLEDAPDGSFYEVWLTSPDGRHVSAGTFRYPGRVEVVAGVRRSEFPRIWITLEPADDDTAPHPATVLDTPPHA